MTTPPKPPATPGKSPIPAAKKSGFDAAALKAGKGGKPQGFSASVKKMPLPGKARGR